MNADTAPPTRAITRHIPNYRTPRPPLGLVWTFTAPWRAVNVHASPKTQQRPDHHPTYQNCRAHHSRNTADRSGPAAAIPTTARHFRIIGRITPGTRPADADPWRNPDDCPTTARHFRIIGRITAGTRPGQSGPAAAIPTTARHIRIVGCYARRNTAGRRGPVAQPRPLPDHCPTAARPPPDRRPAAAPPMPDISELSGASHPEHGRPTQTHGRDPDQCPTFQNCRAPRQPRELDTYTCAASAPRRTTPARRKPHRRDPTLTRHIRIVGRHARRNTAGRRGPTRSRTCQTPSPAPRPARLAEGVRSPHATNHPPVPASGPGDQTRGFGG